MDPNLQQDPAANPQATAQPTPPANPDFSALLQNGKILGKYDDPQAALQGFWQLNNYAAEQARINKELMARIAPAQAPQPTQSYLAQAAEEALVKPELFAAAIREEAEKLINARFAPIENTLGARAHLAAELPDFATNEPAVQAWLATNPELNRIVTQLQGTGTPEAAMAAMRLAYREWQAAQIPKTTPTPTQIAGASLPGAAGTAGPAGAQAVDQAARDQRLAEAVQWARQTGDKRAVFSALFSDLPFYSPEGYSMDGFTR